MGEEKQATKEEVSGLRQQVNDLKARVEALEGGQSQPTEPTPEEPAPEE